MSAAEIIEEIQKLPQSEQQQVVAFVERLRSGQAPDEPRIHYATDEQFTRAADKVLREHADLFRRLAQ
ncbi:hypothetical protein SBV1_1450005 [Verrucomicrobia bacterium]|nr:hypothetical protein SBV1_1450005 [Verrucomicrobiota bacterium]